MATRVTAKVKAMIGVIAGVVVVIVIIIVVVSSDDSDTPDTATDAPPAGDTADETPEPDPDPPDDGAPAPPDDPDARPTAADLKASTLLFPWSVSATKTATVTPPPAGIEPVAVGTVYTIPLNMEGACNNTDGVCSEISSKPHFEMFAWTPTQPVEAQTWDGSGDSWTATIIGFYLSAQYGDLAKCVYRWTEEWDVTVSDAVKDGEVWYATAFDGTMRRSEEFDGGASEGDIANYCPGYAAVDEWSVAAARDFAALPTSG